MHRMTFYEVQEVARRASDGGIKPHGGGPTVHKVADALGLSPTDVQMLLDQSRQGGSPIRDFKVVLGIAALFVAFLLGFGAKGIFSRPIAESPVAAVSTPAVGGRVSLPSSKVGTSDVGAADGAGRSTVAANGAPYQLSAQGAPLDAKTFESDARRYQEEARQAGPSSLAGGQAGDPHLIASAVSAHPAPTP